jgi:hypothetical protein
MTMGEGTPLPQLPARLHNFPSILVAYPQILTLESNEQNAHSRHATDRCRRLMYARILGYLILQGPSDAARVVVSLEVNACNGEEEKFLAIGRFYFDHYIRACEFTLCCPVFAILQFKTSSTVRMNKCSTPIPSSDVSRPSFDTRKAMIMDMVVEAPQSHQQVKANVSVTDHTF